MTEAQHYFHSGPDRHKNRDGDSYFNAQFGAKPLYIKPGEFCTSDHPGEMIVATVGTGIVIALTDKDLKIGGMAHIVLPEKAIHSFPYFDQLSPEERASAVRPFENCLADLKNHGAGKNRVRIRLIGGSVLPQVPHDPGTKTHVFAKEYLTRRGLGIMSEDVAGPYLRRVHYFPYTGRAVRRILRRREDFDRARQEEQDYQLHFKA